MKKELKIINNELNIELKRGDKILVEPFNGKSKDIFLKNYLFIKNTGFQK